MRRKLLIAILILSGLILIFSPFIKDAMIGFMSTRYSAEKLTADQLNENNHRKATFDFGAIQPPSFFETLKAGTSVDPRAVIGQITIKSVGISLPILKGTTTANLLAGATTMRPDQQMGEGNYPLAGHHMRKESLLFGPLMNIHIGARIVITDLIKDYTFEVTARKIVPETDSSMIDQTKEKQITLITCDKPTRTPNRLIVTGKLIGVNPHYAKQH
ncbi:class A sortase [Sporolactobacillus putidus]|uniref:Class A sortase n=1 Tax=Sporolactobacillus putidus TaxID=492735 RepID=A0A917VZU7_9BACL|nr:class A sortase [Sporolactobacillus putidus]GGL49449.1 class A sortase [Sporolactobacillus putidus]